VESGGLSWNPADFLEPISAEAPCGPALFPDMGLLAQQYEMACGAWWAKSYGGMDVEQPQWADLSRQWREALAKSRDLQLAIPFVICELNVAGWPALVAGMELLHGLLEKFWEPLHPVKQGPRSNRLAALGRSSPGDSADRIHFCDQVLDLDLPALSSLTIRDIVIADGGGLAARPGAVARSAADVKSVIASAPSDGRAALLTGCSRVVEVLVAVDAKFEREWGGPLSPKLGESSLLRFLQTLERYLRDGTPAAAEAPAAAGTAASGASGPQASFAGDWKAAMSIRSEEDVRFVLDACRRWYDSSYRASIVPEFLISALRLIGRTHAEFRQMVSEDTWNKVRDVKDPAPPES
jgi:type VI secretion system protein ImpA